MNIVTRVVGHLTADARLVISKDGKDFVSGSVGVRNQNATEFIPFTYNVTGESKLHTILKKGALIQMEGTLKIKVQNLEDGTNKPGFHLYTSVYGINLLNAQSGKSIKRETEILTTMKHFCLLETLVERQKLIQLLGIDKLGDNVENIISRYKNKNQIDETGLLQYHKLPKETYDSLPESVKESIIQNFKKEEREKAKAAAEAAKQQKNSTPAVVPPAPEPQPEPEQEVEETIEYSNIRDFESGEFSEQKAEDLPY